MTRLRIYFFRILLVLVVGLSLPPSSSSAQSFNLDTGNAAKEVIIPRVIPAILTSVSANANDATLVLRITTLITNSWFDAIAPYHPTAVGVYSDLKRQPESARTIRNKNIAMLYASFRVLNSLLPQHAADWDAMLLSVGLNPNDNRMSSNNPVGIGNQAGKAVVAARENDGMNQLGNEGGRKYNRQPYADYLGYAPVNTAYTLVDPSRWQPQVVTMGNGIFRVQQFVTPQLRVVQPYTYEDPNQFSAPPPVNSTLDGPGGPAAYKQQADEVLAISAGLNDHHKMAAELFDNKLLSLGFSALFASEVNGLTLDQFVHYDFMSNVASFDTSIAIWNEKHQYDAVRPFSAIRYLYGDSPVTAWGGVGKGTVSDIPASQWQSYIGTADHPEYPSASASFCAAHAQASRRYFGSDALGWSVDFSAGSSRIEPGITPSNDIVLSWPTWTEFEQECGFSRVRGGVHFPASVPAGQDIGRPIGDLAYDFVQRHIAGTR